jgi:hypothetical protein
MTRKPRCPLPCTEKGIYVAIHGVRWFPSRPPIQGLEYEMDLRGVFREIVL